MEHRFLTPYVRGYLWHLLIQLVFSHQFSRHFFLAVTLSASNVLSALTLEVWSRQGTIQIHVYLTLPLNVLPGWLSVLCAKYFLLFCATIFKCQYADVFITMNSQKVWQHKLLTDCREYKPVLRYVHNWYTGNLANATFQIFITRRHNVTFVLQTQTSRETQCLLGLTEFCAKNLKIVRTIWKFCTNSAHFFKSIFPL